MLFRSPFPEFPFDLEPSNRFRERLFFPGLRLGGGLRFVGEELAGDVDGGSRKFPGLFRPGDPVGGQVGVVFGPGGLPRLASQPPFEFDEVGAEFLAQVGMPFEPLAKGGLLAPFPGLLKVIENLLDPLKGLPGIGRRFGRHRGGSVMEGELKHILRSTRVQVESSEHSGGTGRSARSVSVLFHSQSEGGNPREIWKFYRNFGN